MEWMEVSLTLERTDMPGVPVSLPIGCTARIVDQDLNVHAQRTGTIAADITFDFRITKDSIIGGVFRLKPDVPGDFEYSPWNQPEVSELEIQHSDPCGVVPYFTAVFSSPKSYWVKILNKLLREKLNVNLKEGISSP